MTEPSMIVSTLMSSPVVSVTADTLLEAAYRILVERRISSVPVVDGAGKAVGVLSLTDLLHLGRLQPASLAGIQPLELPKETVGEHMHEGVLTIRPDSPTAVAAKTMVEHHVHRLYVEEEGSLVGVFSIEEVLVAVRGLHIETPIGDVMTKRVITLPVTASLADATSRLDRAGVTGIVIVDDQEHPVGMFTQVEALAARDKSPNTKVEESMSYSLVTLHAKVPLYRAAAHAYEARARRVLVLEDGKLQGLLTGLDFARILGSTGG